MSTTTLQRRLAIIALLGAASCRDAAGPGEPLPGELRGATVHGAAQTGTVAEALRDSVVVSLSDPKGAAVAGVTLEWRPLDAAPGELLARVTRTNAEGRSGNVWVLGPTAGRQMVEVRALLRDGPVVVDTVEATAQPGEAATLTLSADSVLDLAVGDSARIGVAGEDRFGNRVPAARLGLRWTSLHAAVAAVDSTGAVRAIGFGSAILEARAGPAVTRVQLRIRARVESFLVSTGPNDYVSAIRERAGRVIAVSTSSYRTAIYTTVWELAGGAWLRARTVAGGQPWLHVTSAGTSYAKVSAAAQHLVSPRPGGWSVDSAGFDAWNLTAAAGSTFFGAVRRQRYGYPATWGVERWEAGALVDLALPAPYDQDVGSWYLSPPDLVLAAASARELYFSTPAGIVWWNGQGWRSVSRPDGGGVFKLRLLAAAEGRVAVTYGVLGTNLLYRFADGRAERVQNPPELDGRTIEVVAVSDRGDPLVVGNGAVHFRMDGEWREYRIPEGYTVDSAAWADTGAIWLALGRLPRDLEYGSSYRDLRFLRLTVQR